MKRDKQPAELPAKFRDEHEVTWEYLGEGNFNYVYKSDENSLPGGLTGKSILKINKKGFSKDKEYLALLDEPSRLTRLMEKICPQFSESIDEYSFKFNGSSYVGWVMPFIQHQEGSEPSDEELAEAIRDIYQRTERIVVDACSPGNFIKTLDGELVCVDVGLALKRRRGSIASDAYWDNLGAKNQELWQNKKVQELRPKTILYLKILDALDSSEFADTRWGNTPVRLDEFPQIFDTVVKTSERFGDSIEAINGIAHRVFSSFLKLKASRNANVQPTEEGSSETNDLEKKLTYLGKKGVGLSERVKNIDAVYKFSQQLQELESALVGDSDIVVKAQCVFDEVITLAKNPKIKLPELTTVLKETRELLPSHTAEPCGNNSLSTVKVLRLDAYRAKAKRISGKSSWGKRLAGAMLALLGAVVVGISVASIVKSCGLLAVLGIYGVKFGKAMVVKGVAIGVGTGISSTGSFAMWKSKRRSVSKAMKELADAAGPKGSC